jgi:hypothetical protein
VVKDVPFEDFLALFGIRDVQGFRVAMIWELHGE